MTDDAGSKARHAKARLIKRHSTDGPKQNNSGDDIRVPNMAPYCELTAPADLHSYVEACWMFRPKFRETTSDILIPEGVVDLVFNLGAPYVRRSATDRSALQAVSGDVIVGQRTHLFAVEWPPHTHLFAMRLTAGGAHSFMPRPMDCYTNLALPLETALLRGLSRVVRANASADFDDLACLCFDYVRAALPLLPAPDKRLCEAIRQIEKTGGDIGVDALSVQCGLGRRTLERLFSRKLGMSPKRHVRIVRFLRFLNEYRAPETGNWAHTAVEARYYDQAHFIKEFKAFTGESPKAFFKTLPEFYEPLIMSLSARASQRGTH